MFRILLFRLNCSLYMVAQKGTINALGGFSYILLFFVNDYKNPSKRLVSVVVSGLDI